jgi:hypothetical protein
MMCRMSETGHGSRLQDLDEGLKRWRNAKSFGERLFILFYFGRLFVRIGQWGYAATAVTALATMAAAVFGGGWEIGRQMLCDVLRFIENIRTGKPTACAPTSPMP